MKNSRVTQDDYLDSLREAFDEVNSATIFHAIVNLPFKDKQQAVLMDLGIVVLLLVDTKHQTINRIALSDTEMAKGAVRISEKEFHTIKIPTDYTDNIIAQAIASGQQQSTSDWKDLFVPDMTPQAARFNQAGAGIESSVVYPLTSEPKGALIFSYYQPLSKISPEHYAFMEAYIGMVSSALSRLDSDSLQVKIQA